MRSCHVNSSRPGSGTWRSPGLNPWQLDHSTNCWWLSSWESPSHTAAGKGSQNQLKLPSHSNREEVRAEQQHLPQAGIIEIIRLTVAEWRDLSLQVGLELAGVALRMWRRSWYFLFPVLSSLRQKNPGDQNDPGFYLLLLKSCYESPEWSACQKPSIVMLKVKTHNDSFSPPSSL